MSKPETPRGLAEFIAKMNAIGPIQVMSSVPSPDDPNVFIPVKVGTLSGATNATNATKLSLQFDSESDELASKTVEFDRARWALVASVMTETWRRRAA